MAIFTITKSSYTKDGTCFLPELHCMTVYDDDEKNAPRVVSIMEKYLKTTNVDKAWMSTLENDDKCIYVTYNDTYERNNYHAFKILVMDEVKHESKPLTKANYPSLWDKLASLI